MRRLMLVCILLSAVSSVFAQSTGTATGGTLVIPPISLPPVPISYVYTNSVVDQNGNVLIFDSMYSPVLAGATSFPGISTRITVISSDGTIVNDYSNIPGSFQIVGVGHNAVYAIVDSASIATVSGTSTSTTMAIVSPFVFTRTLVALSVVAGTLPLSASAPSITSLPSITLTSNQNANLSSGAGTGGSDVVAIVSGSSFVLPLAAAAASPIANPHIVSLYTYSGGSAFNVIKKNITAP